MSSDASYEAFLRGAQKDYSAGYEPPSTSSGSGTISVQKHGQNNPPHPAIQALGDRYYTSEVDEPFEGISFEWKRDSLPADGTLEPAPSPLFIPPRQSAMYVLIAGQTSLAS